MKIRTALPALVAAGIALVAPLAIGADEPSVESSQALKFLMGLRERGYHDLARDYLQTLRDDPNTPADLKVAIDYHEGRSLLEEATLSGDIDKKTGLLDAARAKLDEFARAHPKHPLAPEALMQLARLYVERGHTALLQSKETTGNEAEAKLSAARAAFAAARKAYSSVIPVLTASHEAFPKFIPEGNPQREQKRLALEALMDGLLQSAVVDYEEAQTWPPGSKERNDLLDKGVASFEGLYKDYRSQLSGQTARMLQGKSYEEKGELGPAMGIYNELLGQGIRDPQFNEMRRRVAYYRIIVDGKRNEHALAVDEAARWLQENPRSQTDQFGLGVKLELAKNLLAMLPQLNEADREEATRKATDRLTEVVRYFSPYKAEALELLGKYKPKSTLTDAQIASLSYEDAKAQADSAMQTHEWDRAIRLWKHAIRRADPTKDLARANEARYFLSYCFYSAGRYYEAAVTAEHLARRYPTRDFGPKSVPVVLGAYKEAYDRYAQIDRGSDLKHLLDFAEYASETWPSSDEGDLARVYLGKILLGQGQYREAAAALEAIRPDSPRKLDAQVEAGDAHWRLAQSFRREGKTGEAEAQEKEAYDLTASALEARKKAGTAATDPALIVNTNALAEILRATGKPKEALALLEPLQKALGSGNLSADVAPLYEGLLTVLLQAHIADGQSAQAIADMKLLEKSGIAAEKLTGLYYDLSQSLEGEMEAQKARNDSAGYRRTQDAYKQFLSALAASEAGQSYESLLFAGRSMLAMGMAKESEAVLNRMLDRFGNDPEFLKNPKAQAALTFVKLKKAEALRKEKKFEPAKALVNDLITQNRGVLDPLMEKGYLLEDWARADPAGGRWNASFAYWKDRAAQLSRTRPRRVEYYECVYHMAVALQNLGKKADAARTLRGVMTLSPSVGSPEMKAKYQALMGLLGS